MGYVRVGLYEACQGHKVPLFRTLLIGFNEFKRLLDAKLVFKVGNTYGMMERV